jgi:type IV pilus assembly protein PilX
MTYLTLPYGRQQKGFILIMTLVMLVMITVLGIAQISINSTQTQVATNTTDSEISFEKAEGALNEAINQMLAGTYSNSNFIANSNGLYLFNQNATPTWQTVNWDSSSAVISSFSGSTNLQTKYIIEQLPSVTSTGNNMKKNTRVYRITGRAVGQTGSSSVLLQSTIQIQQ